MLVPGPMQLGLIALIVALIFGTKKLRAFGGDLGGMFKGIKDGFREAAAATEELAPEVRELKRDVAAIRQAGTEIAFPDRPVYPTQDARFDDSEF